MVSKKFEEVHLIVNGFFFNWKVWLKPMMNLKIYPRGTFFVKRSGSLIRKKTNSQIRRKSVYQEYQ